ncbi:hypothetical protein DD238_008373 [Peronospora effusa]|uniref:Uncharacterized protein n=1 Tax=Peronospora effusa TaxID=542832 RepID=A0A3M6VAH6_9STRA|nr:hypothetical protein DD238_008373 [Peronospora effusa]
MAVGNRVNQFAAALSEQTKHGDILLGDALQTVTTEGDIWCFPCWRIYSLMIAFLGAINGSSGLCLLLCGTNDHSRCRQWVL